MYYLEYLINWLVFHRTPIQFIDLLEYRTYKYSTDPEQGCNQMWHEVCVVVEAGEQKCMM